MAAFLIVRAGQAILYLQGKLSPRQEELYEKAAKGAMAETSALSTAIMESLDGVRVVKIENREGYEEARVAEVIRRRERHLVKGANARAWAAPTTELVTSWIMAAVIA